MSATAKQEKGAERPLFLCCFESGPHIKLLVAACKVETADWSQAATICAHRTYQRNQRLGGNEK